MNGPFFGTHIGVQRSACRAWLDGNNRPDSHPAVRPHSVSPPRDGAFEILSRLWVNRNWADTSKIHCNLCNTSRKFSSGGYLASYDDGWWYVVGPDCGGEEFFGRFNTAKHRYDREEAERVAEGGLRDLLNRLGAWQLLYAQLAAAVSRAEYAAQQLELNERELFDKIQIVRRDDGHVYVVKPVAATDSNGKPYTRYDRDRFTTLAGTKGVSRPCVAAALLRRITGEPLGFLTGRTSLIDAITAHQERGQIVTLQKAIEASLDDLQKAHDAMVEARRFWEHSNLDWISAWIAHPDSGFQKRIAVRSDGHVVHVTMPDDPDYLWRIDVGAIRMYAGLIPG